jgi:hypothetical protein
MNLGEHLNATFNKAGVDTDNPALVELIKKVAALDISDELVTKFNTSYLTVEAAKSNSEIKKHFYAPALNGVDSEILNTIQELEIDEDIKAEILAEKNTYKRVNLLAKKVKELESKKSGATKGEKADLSKQIEALNGQIKEEKLNTAKLLGEKDKEYSDKLKNVYLTQKFSDPKLKYASELATQENFLLPKTILQKELAAKKLRVVIENEDLKLETEDGTPYFENNDKIEFTGFRDRVLAQHKLLEVTNQSQQTQTQKQTVQVKQPSHLQQHGVAKFDQMIQEAEAQTN